MLVVDDVAGIGVGDEDGESDSLFGVLGAVVHGPIGAPGSEENAVRPIVVIHASVDKRFPISRI